MLLQVVSINVKPGDTVIVGQELAVVEAMKMQNVLHAERDCKVKTVEVSPGTEILSAGHSSHLYSNFRCSLVFFNR